MDSLTQITLGAAVGEAVLGKKIGNRAMIWGGIAGTIPDLDVIANAFTTPIEALALHRGFSHSLLFVLVAAPTFGWLIHQFYKQEVYRQPSYKTTVVALLIMVWLSFFGGIIFMSRGNQTSTLLLTLSAVASGGYLIRRLWQYWRSPSLPYAENPTVEAWSWLFGLGFLTHSLLDCFTTYGTQLFAPFSNYRVAFNTISVVDPIYTLPFLACLLLLAFFPKGSPKRLFFNYLGIGISSFYLLLTVINYFNVQHHFEKVLAERKIEVQRTTITPTIFNNVLWQCLAETDSNYLFMNYSIFDKNVQNIPLTEISKNHELLIPFENTYEIKTLKWFSKGFYNVQKEDNKFIFNDLRLAVIPKEILGKTTFAMRFNVIPSGSGVTVAPDRSRPPMTDESLARFWERLKGLN